MLKTPVGRLRLVSILEGVSFLLLLGVCMPIKYAMGYEIAVKIGGPVHGGLFLLLLVMLILAGENERMKFKQQALVFVAAVLPFGFVFVDGMLRRMDAPADASAVAA